jgi:hypothetical protein
MPNYKLVNPYIIGSMNTTFEANSSMEAAKQAYENVSKYFGNSMPSYRFTLKRLSSDNKIMGGSEKSFLHFEAKEKKGENNLVNFEINQIKADKDIKNFQQRLNKVANQDIKMKSHLEGGKPRKTSKKTSRKLSREVSGINSESSVVAPKKKYVDSKESDLYDYDDDLSDYFDVEYDRKRNKPLIYEPIAYYWYDPYIYPLMDTWFMPSFVLPLQPQIAIDTYTIGNLVNTSGRLSYF